ERGAYEQRKRIFRTTVHKCCATPELMARPVYHRSLLGSDLSPRLTRECADTNLSRTGPPVYLLSKHVAPCQGSRTPPVTVFTRISAYSGDKTPFSTTDIR